jgi:hypothetical protein
MEEIRQTFLQARSVTASAESVAGLLEALGKTNAPYRPVAHEGAAMELALKDFSTNSDLSLWNSFLTKSETYLISHAHIGLGWAVAHQEISPSPVLVNMRSMMKFYFFDGWGYYDGTFKQRHAIRNKKMPEALDQKHLHAYDQGIGRSIWYSCLGKIDRVKEVISSFTAERQKDLWRGIGIGCSFVGRCDCS